MKELVKLSSLVPWLISLRDIWVSAGSQALSLVCRDRYLRKKLYKSPWEKTIQRSLEIWEWEVVGGKAPTIKALEFLACYQMMKFMGKIKHARRRRPLLWEGSLDRLEGAAPVDGGERTFQTEGIVSMEGCWDSHNSWASVCGRVVVEVMCILEHPPGSWRPCLRAVQIDSPLAWASCRDPPILRLTSLRMSHHSSGRKWISWCCGLSTPQKLQDKWLHRTCLMQWGMSHLRKGNNFELGLRRSLLLLSWVWTLEGGGRHTFESWMAWRTILPGKVFLGTTWIPELWEWMASVEEGEEKHVSMKYDSKLASHLMPWNYV